MGPAGVEGELLHHRLALAVAGADQRTTVDEQRTVGARQAQLPPSAYRYAELACPAGGQGGAWQHRHHVAVERHKAVDAAHRGLAAEAGPGPELGADARPAVRRA